MTNDDPCLTGIFYELVLYPSEDLLSFRNAQKIFRHSKKDLHCKSFCLCLIKLGLKLQQRGRPLKELRGRHVESIQFFAL